MAEQCLVEAGAWADAQKQANDAWVDALLAEENQDNAELAYLGSSAAGLLCPFSGPAAVACIGLTTAMTVVAYKSVVTAATASDIAFDRLDDALKELKAATKAFCECMEARNEP